MDDKTEADLAIAFMDEGDLMKIIAWLDARANGFDERGREFAAAVTRQLARDLLETRE